MGEEIERHCSVCKKDVVCEVTASAEVVSSHTVWVEVVAFCPECGIELLGASANMDIYS